MLLGWVFFFFITKSYVKQAGRRESNQISGHNFHKMAIRPGLKLV